MKGSITWVPFGEVVKKSQYGISAKAAQGASIPMLRMGNIQDGRLDLSDLVYVELSDSEREQLLLKKGDFLFNRTNSKDLVGKSALVEHDLEATFASYLVRFKLDLDKVDPRFILACFNSTSGLARVRGLASPGVSQYNINPTVLQEAFEIPILPIKEQVKIGDILSTWDRAIKHVNLLLRAYQLHKSNVSVRVFSRLTCETYRLEDVCEKIMVGIASAATHAYRPSGIPMLRNQNIKEGRIDTNDLLYIDESYEKTHQNKRLKEGDVLTVRTGYPGVSAVVPKSLHSAQCFTSLISRPKQGVLHSGYLAHLINSHVGRRFILGAEAGGAQKNVNAATLAELPIPLPKLEVQAAISLLLDTLQNNIQVLQNLASDIALQKQGLMQKLLTGKVRVKV